MALETGSYISDLNPANPLGSDPIAFADDHLRLIKSTVKASFPNISGAVTKTHTQLNNSLDKTGDTMTGPLTLSGAPTTDLQAATKAYVDAANASQNTTLAGKADKATTITAGAGLTGGGDLSSNRTIALATSGVTAGSYGSSNAVPVLTINDKGQVTAASTASLVSQYTLASSSGASATRTIYLTPGTWTLVLDTRAYKDDTSNYDLTATQSASLNGTTASTSIRLWRAGGAGYGRRNHGSSIAVVSVTITTAGNYPLVIQAATDNGAVMSGSIATVYKD